MTNTSEPPADLLWIVTSKHETAWASAAHWLHSNSHIEEPPSSSAPCRACWRAAAYATKGVTMAGYRSHVTTAEATADHLQAEWTANNAELTDHAAFLRTRLAAIRTAAEAVHAELHHLVLSETAPGRAARAAWTALDAALVDHPAPAPAAETAGLLGTVRRKPSGSSLAVLWPSPPDPARWMITDRWGSTGYETDEAVADWPVIGAVPGSPAAGRTLTRSDGCSPWACRSGNAA